MDKDEPKQLKLTNRSEGEFKDRRDLPAGRQGKKEKETKGNKWVIVLLLLATIVVSLIFYFSGPARQKSPGENKNRNQDNLLGAPRVYQF